jgi:hypothetical protein
MMGPRISMVLGLVIGYVEAYGYLDRVILGLNTALLWEQKGLVKTISRVTGKNVLSIF